jgi:hypothetical protein
MTMRSGPERVPTVPHIPRPDFTRGPVPQRQLVAASLLLAPARRG